MTCVVLCDIILGEELTSEDLETLRQLKERVTVKTNDGKGTPKTMKEIVTDMEALVARENAEPSPDLEQDGHNQPE